MNKHITQLDVILNNELVGSLLIEEDGKIYFQYDELWLRKGFNLSPIDLEFDNSLQLAKDPLFFGLHGVFADSISDGWGLMLTDRALQKKFNWTKNTITPLDRLYFMGSRTMGGLEYVPHANILNESDDFNIETIIEETQKIINGDTQEIIKELYLSGGSPGGARPKAVFAKKGDEFVAGYNKIPEGYKGWLVKFFSEIDSEYVGKIEMAYSDMARDAGIIMPETKLVNVKIKNKNYSFFSVERFDRQENKRIHVASLSGLLYASHRTPSVSYKDILALTNHLCKDSRQVEQLSNVMLFNILMHNKDDHTKNFSFRYMKGWELSPAYDLTYSTSMGNQHMSDIYGNGNPNITDVKKLMEEFKIKNIEEKIDNLINISKKWKSYAEKYKIPQKEIIMIEKELEKTQVDFFKKSKPKNKI